ncbi:MAG: hypothetical protein ACRC1H_16160 [Caldilineaceae bacterium]
MNPPPAIRIPLHTSDEAPDAPVAEAAGSLLAPRLGLWTLLGVILLACGAGLYPGTWRTWEGFVPAWNAAAPATLANVATAPDLWRGMGLGALLPAQPLLLLGMAPDVAVKWVLLSTLTLGALGCYAWLAPLYGDRGGALGAVVWLLLPWHLTAIYSRGSLGEMMVLALLPLTLAGLRALAVQGSLLGAGVAVIALLWMWRAQAGVALVASLLLVAYATLVLRHRLALMTAAVAAFAGLLSVAGLLGTTAPPAVPFGEQFVTLYGLLRHGTAVGEPIQIGVATVALVGLSLFALVGGNTLALPEQRRLLWFAGGATVLLAAIALPWAAGIWRVIGAERLFTYPWQPLLVAGPMVAALGGALPALDSDFRRTAFWAATVIALLIGAQAAIAPVYTQVQPPVRPVAIVGDNDLAILQATVKALPATAETPPTATLTLDWQTLHTPSFDDNLFFQALVEGGAGEAPTVLAQLDVQPLADRPATTWGRGEVLTGTWTLALPAEAAGQPLVFHAGFYDWRDGTRRAVTTGPAATPVGADDKLILHATPPTDGGDDGE